MNSTSFVAYPVLQDKSKKIEEKRRNRETGEKDRNKVISINSRDLMDERRQPEEDGAHLLTSGAGRPDRWGRATVSKHATCPSSRSFSQPTFQIKFNPSNQIGLIQWPRFILWGYISKGRCWCELVRCNPCRSWVQDEA